ncbi:MAG TPA: polysaccharide deacetylase family protein [Ktedonobacteraceae bacterium]|nr:polysaccharide deacetylase family protein [Ktedonobacteraceae bacterium]
MNLSLKNRKIPILMYHSVSEHATAKFRRFAVASALFHDHMAYLHQQNYTPLTVTQLLRARAQGNSSLPERPVVLTFDDGFADFYTAALPILQEYNFPATLYIVTAYVGATSLWLQHEGEAQRPMLNWEQVASISAAGIECGGHTHTHPQLDTLSATKAREEIVQCKRILEERLGQEIESFAYPFGYHTATTQRLVQEAGYTSACAVKYAMSSETDNPFSLARLIVSADTSVQALAALLTQEAPSVTTFYKRAATPAWRLARRSISFTHTVRQHKGRQGSGNLV